VNRVFKKIKDSSNAPKVLKEMYRYECKYVNDVWCADSSAGPYLYKDNQKIRLWIIAFIDDASRTITACDLFESDNTNNLIGTLKKAVTKYGKPKVLNMDNGKKLSFSSNVYYNCQMRYFCTL
jgi:Integrase core domain.